MRSIALLVDDNHIKRLLKRLLAPTYTIMRGRNRDTIPKRPFDMAVLDLSALLRLREQIEVCKENLIPIPLPVLLVASPRDLDEPSFQSVKDCFDEIILWPIDERVLEVRLGSLFRSKEQAIQIERSYHALSRTNLAGVIIIQGRRITFANKSVADMCGYSLDEFLQMTPQDARRLIHPEDRRATLRQMHEIYRGDIPPVPTQFRYYQKDGAVRWVEMLVSRILYHGQPALQGTAIDISERKEAMEAVRERELALEKAQAVSHVGSWVWDIQSNHLQWSDEMYRIFGIQKDKFSGDLMDVIRRGIHPDDQEAVNQSNQSVIDHQTPIPLEYRVVRPDGSIRTVWAEAGELTLDEQGHPAKLTGIVQDITERKQVEGALKESQERMTSLYNSMREALSVHELVYDSSGRSTNYVILDVNPMYEEVMDLEREKVIGRLATDVYQVDRAPYLGRYSKVVQTGKPAQFEAYYAPTDRHFQISAFRPAEGQFATVFTDITDRKQVEEKLRESQRRLETLMDNLPGMAYRSLNHPDWPKEIVSLGSLTLTGYPPNAFLQNGAIKFADLIHPEDRQSVWDEVQRALKRKRVYRLLYRIYTAENQMKWVWEQGQGVYDAEDQVVAIEGFIADISERMFAEQAVRASEERYRTLSETTPDIILVHDTDGRIIYVNQAGSDFIGLSRDKIYQHLADDFIPEGFEDEISGRKARRMAGDTGTYQYEMELMNIHGERLPVDVRSTPIIQKGELTGVLVVARDISERKQGEEALQRSQNLLNRSQAIAQVGSWELDHKNNTLVWSDEVYRLFGLDHLQFGATYEAFMDFVHPEDREEVNKAFAQSLLEGGDPYEIEHRIVRSDTGEIRVVLEKCEHIKDQDGTVISSIGMVQDITERRLAQQALEDSERKFREVVAQATDGIVLADSHGMVIEWNDRQTEITGIDRQNAIGQPIWRIQSRVTISNEGSKEFEARQEKLIRSMMQSPQSQYYGMTFEHKIRRSDASIRFIETALYPIQYGDEFMVVSLVRDVTDRKQAEEEQERLAKQIRDQASELEQILATVPAGVVLLNGEGIIQQANPVGAGALSILANAKVGDRLTRVGPRPLHEVLNPPPEGLWHEIEAISQVFEVIARPMEEGGTEGYWVLVINDVTRDREIRKQLQQQGQLAAVGQLAAGIAHDFNNIIAIIGLYAELGLNTSGLDRKIAERFEMIEQQADRAARLTQQIMDFSRSSILKRHPIDLCDFFDEFVELIEQTLPANIEVRISNTADICTVNADPGRLQQALLNLVLNARDAMRSTERGLLEMDLSVVQLTEAIMCVTCGQISRGEWIRIQVRDNGSGIEPGILTHIFEPFFTTKDVGQGTGLGLAQVYGIVKQHDGHINVESGIGTGTTFSICLPLSAIDPVVLESQESGRIFGRGETILVVEDSPVLRRALCETLELLNYKLVEAENGKEALERLETNPDIALVLSDLVMPDMGGQDMFKEMQNRQIRIPVVMLSGHPSESEMARLQLNGLAGWLQKPPTPDQLAGIIAQALRASRQSSEG